MTARPRSAAFLLFAFALIVRLFFWHATADTGWPHSVWYQGDAATWQAWARAISESTRFEVGLPMRPPGTAYLIAAVSRGDPTGIIVLKFLWCVMGALTVLLVYIAVRRSLGETLARPVGVLCAASTGLMVLSTSLNNETPYLLVVVASLIVTERVRSEARPLLVTGWSLLQALGCLLRAEHLLYVLLLCGFLALAWSGHPAATGRDAGTAGPRRWRATVVPLGLAVAIFALALAPWHLGAWSDIHDFNNTPLPADPVTADAHRRLEVLLEPIVWEDAAEAEIEALPVAVRPTARLFITATRGVRGYGTVETGALGILEEAFGAVPEPLGAHPFIALSGGLNFNLANNPTASGGFDRGPLERPPPLAGGVNRYPLALVQGLPPSGLTLTYPPHLEIVNHGYRHGWAWIHTHAGAFLRLAMNKLRLFWGGAALGLGGYNLPLGLSGVRREVDLVVPEGGATVAVWRSGLLLLAWTGLWLSRRNPASFPWTALLVSKLLVTLAFFGYARQGASVIPVVALLVCLGARAMLSRLVNSSSILWLTRRGGRLVWGAALVLLAIEAGRWFAEPDVVLDGRAITAATAPFPSDDYRERFVDVR